VYKTAVGARRFREATVAHFSPALSDANGRTNDSGEDMRPTRKASEKLSVARDERNMPSRRREKHLIRWNCCTESL